MTASGKVCSSSKGLCPDPLLEPARRERTIKVPCRNMALCNRRQMGVAGSAAGGVLAAELCAPLLLLCWLCCWPDAASGQKPPLSYSTRLYSWPALANYYYIQTILLFRVTDSSSSGHPRKPIIASEGGRRAAGSAASLHVPGPGLGPGPSGGSPARSAGSALASYRSHEELSSSAPGLGVLREVLLRRDWDRSTRDLYIPLSPPAPGPAPRATLDTPLDEDTPRCKKHHSNIKCSRGKEQRAAPSERDQESPSRFYIGDDADADRVKERPPEKEEKQCLNESIRSKGRPWRPPGAPAPSPDELTPDEMAAPDESTAVYDLTVPDELIAPEPEPDRSGAVHHTLDSCSGMGSTRVATLSPISVVGCILTLNARRIRTEARIVKEYSSIGQFCGDRSLCSLRALPASHCAVTIARRASRPRSGHCGEHALRWRRMVAASDASNERALVPDVVGYEYLSAESPSPGECRDRCGALPAAAPAAARARHASDGDILAPAPRPESGAFSESDLDLELRLALQAEEHRERAVREARGADRPARDVRETAI
ncbi:hypothetical protein MSG28_012558 [Choristoneura fumiferana]|uniref:Uncharacterized protein n=1 Tax=Choristoneura fumiferana TaxID=7141 RepID=A0ACC0JH36_CHOFU|nr:hypothetical protein MSG28_012558 [Choristoneura fumiferana]